MTLVLQDLTVLFGERPVVDRVSLTLPPASLVALVGPNGAGKTSLLRALVGLVRATGTARLDGADLARMAPQARARALSYLPQGHEAHWPLPARDIVALGRIPHGASDPSRLRPEDSTAVDDAMRITGTGYLADRPVTTLSGGERARVALARVFAVGARLILADEPTAALDPRHQIDVMRALQEAARAGALVIAVTHDLGLAARFADRVVVMMAGRVEADGAPDAALAPEVLRRVFGVEAYRAEHGGRMVVVPWS
ncbi:ABC transporter ATP-binding protein [uncultured Enterovirga sp.]|uniref:ABC transporter ATP-binding protein n=1 Tax=uncultured Enterovirga sp. TaxID=2026352 RepID=UPI0035CC6410